MLDEIKEHPRAHIDVLRSGVLFRVVADAAATTDEYHTEWNAAAERHRVVTGAAGKAARRQSQSSHRCGQSVGKAGIARRRRSLVIHFDLRANAARPGDLTDAVDDVAHSGLADGVIGRAHVEREGHRARHRIRGGMVDLQPSDRRDEIRLPPGAALDRGHHDRRSGQSVTAQGHRRGARVRALPDNPDLPTAGAADPRDHSDRAVLGLEHRPLLDMDFDIADDVFQSAEPSAAMRVGLHPNATSASRREIPSASRSSRVASSKRPASARDPPSAEGKRTPSSSPNATTSMAKDKRRPCLRRRSTISMAVITPRFPS